MSLVLRDVRFQHREVSRFGRVLRWAGTTLGVCGPAPSRREALQGITVTFPQGATSAILGHSGSGKTTLLNLLSRLWDGPPTSGHIIYEGRDGGDYAQFSAAQATRLRRQRFGFVLQSAFLIRHLSAADNIGFPLALQGMPEAYRRERIDGLLKRTGMQELARHPVRRLSGGEQQRLAILRAIIHNPDVLFADEPFSSLDPQNTRLLIELLQAWQSGQLCVGHEAEDSAPRTLILVTHDLASAWRLVAPPNPPTQTGGFLFLHQGRNRHVGLLPPAHFPNGPADLEKYMS